MNSLIQIAHPARNAKGADAEESAKVVLEFEPVGCFVVLSVSRGTGVGWPLRLLSHLLLDLVIHHVLNIFGN